MVCLICVSIGHEGSEKEDCCLARLSIYNYVIKSDVLGMTLAVLPIPCSNGCINSKASILFESEVFVDRSE